ncbi:MAG: protein O-mannosyl-transferase family [Anaerolineae bacterium]
MNANNQSAIWKSRLPVLAGSAALLVYLATMAPSLTWAHWGADGGDFITAAVTGRMPHPPGFPLYLTLARLFVLLPLRDPAWRLNLLSAVMAAGTVTLAAMTLQRQEKSPWIVLSTALALAFTSLFWSQALITEVYTTAAFFAAWANYKLQITNDESRITDRHWLLSGIVCGLGMAVHPTLVLLLPLWLTYLFIADVKRPDRASRITYYALRFIFYVSGIIIGLLPYVFLPFLGRWPQPWGDLRTFAGWWDVVTARLYRGYAFGLPLADWPARVAAWAALLARQFTPVGGVLVLFGGWLGWRKRRWEVVGLAVAGGLLSLFAISYSTPDSLMYLLPLLPLSIPLLGVGLHWLVDKGLPAWVTLVLPVVLLAWNWQAVDLHRDNEAVLWYNQVLSEIPADAVLITTEGDPYTFALWYAQEALGLREDVLVIDRNLWWQESYRQFLFIRTGCEVAVPEDYAVGRPLCRIVEEGVACP